MKSRVYYSKPSRLDLRAVRRARIADKQAFLAA